MERDKNSGEDLDDTAEGSVSVDEQIQTAFDWAIEGPRGGNFLVIKTDEPSEDREELLRSKGYDVLSFKTVGEADLAKLMRLFEVAQTYGDRRGKIPDDLPQGKVALIFSEAAWTELGRNKQVFNAYQGNAAYMVWIGFAKRPENLE